MSCVWRLLTIHQLNISGKQAGNEPRGRGRAGGAVNGKQLEQANRVMSGIGVASAPRVRLNVYARQWTTLHAG